VAGILSLESFVVCSPPFDPAPLSQNCLWAPPPPILLSEIRPGRGAPLGPFQKLLHLSGVLRCHVGVHEQRRMGQLSAGPVPGLFAHRLRAQRFVDGGQSPSVAAGVAGGPEGVEEGSVAAFGGGGADEGGLDDEVSRPNHFGVVSVRLVRGMGRNGFSRMVTNSILNRHTAVSDGRVTEVGDGHGPTRKRWQVFLFRSDASASDVVSMLPIGAIFFR